MRADPPRSIDLNADVGEHVRDLGLVPLLTSANVACGGHAGDRASMQAVVEVAMAHGAALGAHPSYADRAGFGRVERGQPPEEVVGPVLDQIAALASVAATAGARVRYVKFHGALYHRANTDRACAEALVEGLAGAGLGTLVLLAEGASAILELASAAGFATASEGFCDRAYGPDGHLLDRRVAGAVLEDPAAVAAQAVSLATSGTATAAGGSTVAVNPDSLCLHGDSPGALRSAECVRAALARAGVTLRPFAS